MKNNKNVMLRNYILFSLVIIISIIIVIYFFMWYKTYESERLSNSTAGEYLNVIQYNELDNYLVENKDAIIYVSISNDKEIFDFEKKFRRLINKRFLINDILYMNITDELKNDRINKQIKDKYSIDVPYIIIFDDGNIKSMYDIKYNGFDIDLLENYFVEEGIISD